MSGGYPKIKFREHNGFKMKYDKYGYPLGYKQIYKCIPCKSNGECRCGHILKNKIYIFLKIFKD